MRTRPRRLLLALAATALAVAASLAIIAPLHAQDQTQVGFVLPGNNSFVTGEEIAQGDSETFTEGSDKKRVSVKGRTFPQMLDMAEQRRGERITGVGVYALDRGPDEPPLYLTEGDNLFFFVQSGVVKWFLYNDDLKVLDRGDGATLRIDGLAGEHLTVEIAITPEDARAGDEVTFDANATGAPDGEKLSYRWFVDGFDKVDGRGETFKQTFKNQGSHTVYVDVRGDKGSRGAAETSVDIGKKKPPPATSGGSGGSGGSSGSGGSGGTTPGTGGGTAPGYTPPASPPSTSPLPPPSSSPPSSDPGRGPNLDPSAPSGGDTGQSVEGILVSTSAPPKAGQARPGQTAQARQQQAKKKSDEVDWPLVGGISLTALLVILGAVRERRHIQRLLPHPSPQTS